MRLKFAVAFCGSIASVMSGAVAYAGSGGVVIEGAWSRASVGTMRPGVAYMSISNDGDEPVVLTGLRSGIAKMPQIHMTSTNAEGISSMAPAGEIEIAPGEAVALEPGGLHVMLMSLNSALREGESHTLTLLFSDGDPVTVEVPILGIGARGPKD